MSNFHLKIIACDRVFYEGDCESFTFQAIDGEMAVLANHESMTTALEPGEIRYRIPEEKEPKIAVVSDGLIKVDHNDVEVMVYSAVKPEEMDAFLAQEELEREGEQLAHKQSLVEYNLSQSTMARSIARLRGTERFKRLV